MGLASIMHSKTLQQSVLSDLLLWIDNNLDKKLTVDDLSDISGYSPWHLFRLFRHYFDRSPMEYIRQQRMSLCRRLLLATPGYRIVDICIMVGYDDLSAFNRTFKNIMRSHPLNIVIRSPGKNKEGPPPPHRCGWEWKGDRGYCRREIAGCYYRARSGSTTLRDGNQYKKIF